MSEREGAPSVKVYLLRHAKAGERTNWDGDDELRPLTKPGRRQAQALIEIFQAEGIDRIMSSPSVRCRQSVEPLAERLKLPVDLADSLAEGSPIGEAMRLIDKVAHRPTVLCTHGDIVGGVLERLHQRGIQIESFRLEKASTWVLEIEAGAITSANYWTPPTS